MEHDQHKPGEKELVLAPGSYAFIQDVSKGTIRTYVGPHNVVPTQQDIPVIYDRVDGVWGFHPAPTLKAAVRKSPIAVEGSYLVLFNPVAEGEQQPEVGAGGKTSPDLQIGRRIHVHGPVMYPLWPGQAAQVIRGHQISRNEYLKVRVYNEEEARKNWGKAVVQRAAPVPTEGDEETKPDTTEVAVAKPPADLTVGKLLIIKGEEVSFYIPPTGMVVEPDGTDSSGKPVYVRDALTLERLEYCVLTDESGNKRYEKGPQVVFPLPTETFRRDSDNNRKFRAPDLNKIQGLHIKVIAPYTEEIVAEDGSRDVRSYVPGDEIFITGAETAIYYPREEHSLVRYDGQAKHFATAVPAGEARYLMDRMSGVVTTEKGPQMLLPNPIHQVIVRRVLSPKQAALWYPDNLEVIEFNDALREAAAASPTTRAGAVSEGDVKRRARTKGGSSRGLVMASVGRGMDAVNLSEQVGSGMMADEFERKSTYTQPRTITLDKTSYGVPKIQPWTGYSVMVVNKDGARRVVQGPSVVLLEYDESLEVLEMSTGKPKTTDNLLKTVYLRTSNNKVSDIVEIDTFDHVTVVFKLSYVVDFIGDPMKWFSIENYVKFMCDHMRSLLKAEAKSWKVADLYADPAKFILGVVLGGIDEEGNREGHLFEDNGMHIKDVEVLKASIDNKDVAQKLREQQYRVVSSNIEIQNAKADLEATQQLQDLARKNAEERAKTQAHRAALILEENQRETDARLAAHAASVTTEKARVESLEAQKVNDDAEQAAVLARQARAAAQAHNIAKATQDLRVEYLVAEAETIVKRFSAAAGPLSEAMLTLSDRRTLVEIAEAMSAQKMFGGQDFAEAIGNVFDKTPLADVWKRTVERAAIERPNGGLPRNGSADRT